MDFTRLAGLAGGHAEARAIQVALKLGFFEFLKEESHDAAWLARTSGCNPRATMLLANALVALGLLELNRRSLPAHRSFARDAARRVA